MITAGHQTFSGQFRCLSDQTQFDLTNLLYFINGKIIIFIKGKVMSGHPYHKHCNMTLVISKCPIRFKHLLVEANNPNLFLLCLSSLSLADSDSEQLSLLLELELLESEELSEVGSPSL